MSARFAARSVSSRTCHSAVGQDVVGDAAGVGHAGQAEVGREGDQDRDQVALQLGGAGLLAAGVGEAVQEPGALVHLDQQRHDRRERQHLGQLGLQFHRLGRDVLCGQRGDHQIPVIVQPDRTHAPGQGLLQIAQRGVHLIFDLGQARGGVGGLAHQPAELHPLVGPLARGKQVGGRVGVAARLRHPHVPRPQGVPQREQHAQLPVVPLGGGVAALGGGVQVAAPLRGHEPGRRVCRDLAGAGGVEFPQAAAAPILRRWPATTASPAPPPTGIWTRSSSCWRSRPRS
jgi:hypothetical protein